MPSPDRLAAFLLVTVIVTVVPGPSVLFVVGRALAHGRRRAGLTVLGNAGGELVQAAAVAVGLGPLVAESVLLLSILKYAGAAYLVYLGVRTLIRSRSVTTTAHALGDRSAQDRRAGRTWLEAFVVGVSNPKSVVFFAAVLPQFVDPAGAPPVLQLLVLGVVFVLVAVATDSVWALAAGTARDWFARSPRRLRVVDAVGGFSMIGLGLGLAVTGRRD